MPILRSEPQTNRKVCLKTGVPLYPLMLAFPCGVPVKPYILSLDDREFYEFCPKQLPDESYLVTLSKALSSCPAEIHYALGRHHVIAIPLEWVKEVN